MTRSPLTVIRLVDDNADYRASEAFMLRMLGYNVAEYVSALDFLENDDPSVAGGLVLDVKMLEMTGLELQDVMTEKSIGLPIIFLTGHGDIEMAVDALHKGAFDFLVKPADPEKLKASVERALAANQTQHAVETDTQEARKRFALLTAREKDVCRLVVKGLLNKQIAGELGITEHTVKVHRAAARYKLKARTTVDLVHHLQLIGEA